MLQEHHLASSPTEDHKTAVRKHSLFVNDFILFKFVSHRGNTVLESGVVKKKGKVKWNKSQEEQARRESDVEHRSCVHNTSTCNTQDDITQNRL